MRVKDIMSTNVITVSSKTTIGKADEILTKNRIRRLPVVDNEKLVGIISKDGILNASTPYSAPVAPWKMAHYFFARKVREIMGKKLVTATPEMTATSAAYLAQKEKVGCLPVLNEGKLVGIVTTNDFFFKILNPLLGIWQSGTQFIIHDPGNIGDIERVIHCLNRENVKILAIRYLDVNQEGEKNLAIRIESREESRIEASLKDLGYNVEIRHPDIEF